MSTLTLPRRLSADRRDLAAQWAPYARRLARAFASRHPGFRRDFLSECVSAANEALCKAAEGYDESRGPFPPYAKEAITRALWRVGRAHWRHQRATRAFDDVQWLPDRPCDPEEEARHDAARELLRAREEALLAILPEAEAEVVRLVVFRRMSLADAAECMGWGRRGKERARQTCLRAVKRVSGWALFLPSMLPVNSEESEP